MKQKYNFPNVIYKGFSLIFFFLTLNSINICQLNCFEHTSHQSYKRISGFVFHAVLEEKQGLSANLITASQISHT